MKNCCCHQPEAREYFDATLPGMVWLCVNCGMPATQQSIDYELAYRELNASKNHP